MTIFTLEVAGKSVAWISADDRTSAEEIADNPWFRDGLLGIERDGPALWDGVAELQLRRASPDELARIKERVAASEAIMADEPLTMFLADDVRSPSDHTYILASRVEHTPVYNGAGERIGNVADLSIDRQDGQVVYAIMSFGGFLGIGARFHPIPWSMLHYDLERSGYVVPLEKGQLEDAPHYEASELREFGGPKFESARKVIAEHYTRYGLPPI